MPKQRTRKAAAKRFRMTKKGKVLHRKHYSRHLRSKKSKKTLRTYKRMHEVNSSFATKIKKMLGRA